MKNKVLLLILFVITGLSVNAQTLPKLGKDPLSKVISAMTLEEKVNMVVGMGMRMPGAPPEVSKAIDQMGPVVGQTQPQADKEADMMASFMRPQPAEVTYEEGTYTIRIGASSKEIKQTATFTLGNDLNVKKESSALLPKVKINELKPL